MYKVFLVDDEIVIREGIRNSFSWDTSAFTLCGEAPDGEIALPMMQELKPDILVTDIRMPFMDGLTLSRKVSETMPWVHIVILSGHDDFSYAREAITLGVKEYLLKPVSAQKLEEVLTRITGNIQDERARQADMDTLRQQLASSTRYAQEQLLRQLLAGEDAGPLFLQAEGLYMRLESPTYLVMLLAALPQGRQLALQGILQRLAEGMDGAAYQTVVGGNPALLVLGQDSADIEERAYTLARALAHEAAKNGMEAPAVAIGEPVGEPRWIPQSLASAQAVLGSMQGQPRRIVSFMDMDAGIPPELIGADILPLYERLRYAAQQEGGQLVESYFYSLGDKAPQSLLVMHYLLVDMVMAAARIIKQYGGDPAQVLPERLLRRGALLRLTQNPQDILAAGKEVVALALAYRDANAFSRYGEILRKACAYIGENYHRPELTLQDVASHVALSNNHFCTIFSQEMGQTFLEYLTGLRMEKATALLLSSALRSSDISQAVGYNDPHYFSYLFKKNTGLSPRDFRREKKAGMDNEKAQGQPDGLRGRHR